MPHENFKSKGMLSGVADRQTHTDRHSYTKVNTEDNLSGFLEFFRQPIIKDRSKKEIGEEGITSEMPNERLPMKSFLLVLSQSHTSRDRRLAWSSGPSSLRIYTV